MKTTEQPPQVEVHDVTIDHVNVRERSTSDSAQKWNALTPLLTLVITGIGIMFSFGFNLYQNQTTKQQKIDSDWREALAKGIDNGGSPGFIALEMETFADDPKYGDRAKSIMYSALPKIASEFEFDTAFRGAMDVTLENDQDALLKTVHQLTVDVENLREKALLTDMGSQVAEKSIPNFVKSPELFLSEGDDLAKMNVLTAKLDSASAALRSFWVFGPRKRGALRLGDVDLTGLILLNGDFSGVDFHRTSMSESFILGRCQVDKAKMPTGDRAATVDCSVK